MNKFSLVVNSNVSVILNPNEDEQLAMNRTSASSRRSPHTGRVVSGPRSRRTSLHFGPANSSIANASAGRDLTDPLAEILHQLSGGRRGGAQSSQLQQLQMQIQMERHQVKIFIIQIYYYYMTSNYLISIRCFSP